MEEKKPITKRKPLFIPDKTKKISVVVQAPLIHETFHKDYATLCYQCIRYSIHPDSTVLNLKEFLAQKKFLPHAKCPMYSLDLAESILEMSDSAKMEDIADKASLLSIYPDIYGEHLLG